MRRISSTMTLILVAGLLLIGTVSATWIYATGTPGSEETDVTVSMTEWEFSYTVSFKNNGELLLKDNADFKSRNPVTCYTGEVVELTDTSKEPGKVAAAAATEAVKYMNELDDDITYEFSHWINAGSTRVDSIPADNTDDITLYPSFVGVYTAMFVDQDGNILAWDTFTANNYSNVTAKASSAQTELEKNLDSDLTLDYWEVRVTKNGTTTKKKLSEYEFKDEVDVTIYPVCTYNGDVNLIPVDEDGDGDTDSYQVGGYSKADGTDLVEIPDTFNGISVTTVNAKAFSGYAGVHAIVLPKYVEFVGDNAISDATVGGFFGTSKGETVTIYYSGSKSEWLERETSFDDKWDYGISSNSKIYFLDENGKVDPTQGYLQASPTTSSGFNQSQTGVEWNESTIDESYINNMYTVECDCSNAPETTHDYGNSTVNGRRPDYIYWGEEDGSAAITMPTS